MILSQFTGKENARDLFRTNICLQFERIHCEGGEFDRSFEGL